MSLLPALSLDEAIDAFGWSAACVPAGDRPRVVDVRQIVYALERARDRLQAEADALGARGDYSAEFPAEDADRMREAIALLQARPAT